MNSSRNGHGLAYRPEIDGLRALAVVPVILFHAGFEVFRGGYVGVDIFFVISGYLITRNILTDLDQGRFGIVDFYDRRARRILPALFLVMLACIPFAWFWMLPDPLENFGQSVFATTLFSNNILLYLTASYWDLAAEFKPLLHTWSLGIEEQFYLAYPILLILLFKFRRQSIPFFLLLFLSASLLFAQVNVVGHPIGTFYLIPARCWELMMGAIVAFHARQSADDMQRNKLSDIICAAGLALIAYAVLAFDKDTPTPSLYTVVPILGTLAILQFGRRSALAAKLLSNRAAVAVGLMSYSAYLWHQPFMAFQRVYLQDEPTVMQRVTLLALIPAVSYLSWKFVETPCRNRERMPQRVFWGCTIGAAAVLIVFGLSVHFSHGFPNRIYDADDAVTGEIYIAYNNDVFKFQQEAFTGSKAHNVLVVGNSFARDFVNMMRENLNLETVEIVYRDGYYDCLRQPQSIAGTELFEQATIVIFASGGATKDCVADDIAFAEARHKKLLYIGTKGFGYNLNWLARLDKDERKSKFNKLRDQTVAEEATTKALVPDRYYLSLLAAFTDMKSVPITDQQGRLLSPDRAHLTRFGAIYVGRRALGNQKFQDLFGESILKP